MTNKPAAPEEAEDAQRALERQAIERLDAGEPATSPEEAAVRAPYAQLIERLQVVEDDCEPPPGWEDRAVELLRRRRRWRKRAAGAAISLGSLGLAALLLLRCTDSPAVGLEVAVLEPSGQMRRGAAEATVGDRLRLRGRGEAPLSLLLYLRGKRIASCPGSEGCRRDGPDTILEWPLTEAADYQLAVVTGGTKQELPGHGLLDLDVIALREAGARVELCKLIVTP